VRFLIVLIASFLLLNCGGRPHGATGEKQEERARQSGPIEMTLEAQKHVGLQVTPARLTQLTEYLQVTGTVQPIDSLVTAIRPLARGRVTEVFVRVGDRVRAGQPLARFDNMEAVELLAQVQSARAELQRLKVQLAAQARQTGRLRRLAEIGASPRKEHEQSQAEQQAIEESIRSQEAVIAGLSERLRRLGVSDIGGASAAQTALPAPFDGVVVKAEAAPGMVAGMENSLFSITNLSRVWVQAEVYEKDLGKVRVGQTAFVTVDTYPRERFPGRVTHISDVLDPGTRTARVRCELPNPGARLKLEMFAAVRLPTGFNRQAVALPAGAVQQIGGKDVAFVRIAQTRFEARTITKGRTVDGLVEIAAGLNAGEPVVTQGAFHLKSILVGGELGEEE